MLDSYMRLAVQQARRGGPATYQNPQVGAVLVKAGRVIGQGYHHQFGAAHAEVDCLNHVVAGETPQGATMYVTLEPCSHYGKTPPCSHRLVAAGIRHVVIGQLDPHAVVAGRGRAYLLAHGVTVDVLSDNAEIEAVNRHYNWFYRQRRPWITLKSAQTLDGKINAVTGERSQVSHAASLADSQQVRAHFQAILVGERTLKTDDPRLTVRLQALAHLPVRLVVVDQSTAVVGKRLVQDATAPTWVLCRRASSADKLLAQSDHVHVVVGDWTPAAISTLCSQQGWQSLLVEGGSHLQAQFVQAGLVEEWLSYLSPVIYGGASLPAVQDPELKVHPITFTRPTVTVLGPDYRLQAYRTGVE